MKSMIIEGVKLENLVSQLFDSVNREKIYRIYSNWSQTEIAKDSEAASRFKNRWLEYFHKIDNNMAQDDELKNTLKELDEVDAIINYDLIEDYPRRVPEDWRDANTNEIVLNKLRLKREKAVYENWATLSRKYDKTFSLVGNIKPSFISKLIHLGLNAGYNRKKEAYEHYEMVDQKLKKQEEYIAKGPSFLDHLNTRRDVIICKHIEDIVMEVFEESPELFCVNHPTFQHIPQTRKEKILFDYIEVVNSLRTKLCNDFFEEKTEEICKYAKNI